ncbi:hypothetical protein FQN49_005842 [Arthroderma sp. PD_2]|nr:hypothetical protein FQN49_005842 [Arthroderma sp. PD_2]
MASDPPEEALHFRGKTLTPESPRPLHIAEPSNIPLLQNQMDAAYHDTSAFESIPEVKEHTVNPALAGQGIEAVDQFSTHTYSLLQSGLEQMNTSGAGPSGITGSFPGSNTKAEGIISENESIFTSTTRDEILTSSLSSPVPDPAPPNPASHIHIAVPEDNSSAALLGSNNDLGRPDALDVYQAAPGPSLTSYDYQQPQVCASESEVAGDSLEADAAASHNSGDIRPDISQNSLLNTAVTYQNLLDSSAPSSFPTPTATITTAAHPAEPINQPTQSLGDISSMPKSSLPYPSTLPPRPPAHETESIKSSHADTGSGHPSSPSYTQPSKEVPQDDHSNRPLQGGYPLAMDSNLSVPSSSFAAPQQVQAPLKSHSRKASGSSRKRDSHDENIESAKGDQQDDTPWGPDIQKKYDDFLRDERVYVTEAHWDRFPVGSRLFIGNLPTERVTKRDLFHLFHMHGKLAQISIKQAYGFIQFLEPDSCRRALQTQQGATVRGRKIHLEISKPQRSARNSGPAETGGRSQRRSRSPEYERTREPARGGRSTTDRYDRFPGQSQSRLAISDFREKDQHRYRDRTSRSPSPRGPRRDSYHSRERNFDRYDRRDRRRSRSRSPRPRNARYRSPSPRDKGYDSESDLPIPRRDPRNVPEVQVIVLENADNEFVYRVENAFRDRGLRCDVLILSPRIRLSAVVRRQVLEGVLAIVRISRANQYSGKIPLQIFDRTGGLGNVRFNGGPILTPYTLLVSRIDFDLEYSELDLSVAAEIVVHARNSQKPSLIQLQPQPQPQLLPVALPAQPIQQLLPPQQSEQAAIANLLSNLDSTTLHSLLNTLNQQQQLQAQQQHQQTHQFQPQSVPTTAPQLNSTNLAALLGNLTRQSNANPPSIPATTQSAQFAPPTNPNTHPTANLASLLAKGPGGDASLPQPQANPQVQQIMEQLMKWKQ